MLKDYLQVNSLSIVFIGDFNPVIIQPFWLANKKLIKEQEAVDTDVELIHNELVKFDLGWASTEITKKRFEVRTAKEPYFEPLRDLVISIFTILPETPIEAMGINHIMHFALPDKDKFYEFGNKLAPLNNWEDVINNPRVLSFEVHEKERKDGLPGFVRIKVRPSDQNIQYGVSININDHYALSPGENGRNGEMMKCLKDNWANSYTRADEIIEKLWEKI
ncbi:MAG: hypothetical protein PHR81_11800 [Bacteroidales bacterium]|jgi:hypothetical protein|nr:hypothetical protein [Bacteroidales bacterium]MDD4215483.1 hypothetical protein [Bacteroidales bacterium]